MSQIQIKDATGAVVTAAKVDNTGQTTRSASLPVTVSTEDMTALSFTKGAGAVDASTQRVTLTTKNISSLVPGITSGIVNTSNTTAVTGSFKTIQCITDVMFTALTETGATGSLTSITIPAGTVLSGVFTGYTLSFGTVRAYP